MRKTWVVVVLLLLVACHRDPVPVEVQFPDDSRVLHGDWQLQLTERLGSPGFQFDSAGQRLLITGEGLSWAYVRDGDGWQELDTVPAGRGSYDRSLDAWVQLSRSAGQLTAVSRDWDNNAVQTSFSLPADGRVENTAVGSGRVFSVVREDSGLHAVHWWSLTDPADHGQRRLPTHREGMKQSGEGRFLSFWDIDANRIHVLDTAAPEREVEFRMGTFCRSSGPSAADPAGRWFVTTGCSARLQVFDLHDPAAGPRSLGISSPLMFRFAADGSELLWLDSSLNVRGRNLTTGESFDYQRLSDYGTDTFAAQWAQLYRNAAAGLFAVRGSSGSVAVFRDGSAETRLPALPFRSAALQLVAELEGTEPVAADYLVSGSFEPEAGAGPLLTVNGWASGGSHHVYRPLHGPPPPPFRACLELCSADGEQCRYGLEVEAVNNSDVDYGGSPG